MVLTAPQAVALKAPAEYAQQAVTSTNLQRSDNGLRTLADDKCLARAAVRQAKAMAAREEMFHQDIYAVLRKCRLREAGENVAYGFDTGASVVADGWMNSPEHRANILRSSYNRVGIGAVQAADGTWYAAQVFGRR
ncbi:MAG TPA: hypothetical protein DEQ43_23520 [Nocardioides bacterium]|nr:hypothetical protein [Acidimicrobiaceae bacterium]HCB07183.1 hypothetical protein [Nocardioides sp.]